MRYGMNHIKDIVKEFDVTIEWAIGRRKLFLEDEINYLKQHQKEMMQLLSGSNSQDRDFIFDSIKRSHQEIHNLTREIYFLSQNDYTCNGITDEMIAQAKEYTISQLIEVTNNMAYCINHVESHPSMNCKNNFAYCHACGWRGDTIDVKMKIDNINFVEAVKLLQ